MHKIFPRLKLATFVAVTLASLGADAMAQDSAAAAATPDNQISYNVALTTDYRYRGLAQSHFDPALQGGADYTHTPTGFYAGTWLSTIKWISDAGGDADVEWDLYAGKRGEITKDVTYDVGVLGYIYPSAGLGTNPNTYEIYGQVGYGPGYIKYSHSTSNLFGTADSKGSGYFDAGITTEIKDGYMLNLHVGRQKVRHNDALSYTDYKIGVSKDFGVVAVALSAVTTTTDMYVGDGKNLGKGGVLLTVSKIF
jgi:uncharacterized protein (TIGR02001 family)